MSVVCVCVFVCVLLVKPRYADYTSPAVGEIVIFFILFEFVTLTKTLFDYMSIYIYIYTTICVVNYKKD